MLEYRHGGSVRFESGGEDFLDFSANINPMGIPDGVAEAIKREIASCRFYPDGDATALRESIAEFEQVSPDWIFCGNGASDIIFRLPLCVRPKNGLVICPTFCDYERAFKAFGTEVKFHKLDESNGFACDERLLETVERVRPGLAFFCNPNNPTGILAGLEQIKQLLNSCATNDCLLAMDECFLDFSEHADDVTAKRFLQDHDNLVVIKAMTKTFALPGLRIGYAISGNKRLLEKLRNCGPDWAVSNIAQAAGVAALQGAGRYLEETVTLVKTERNFLKQSLEGLGCRVFDGAANFLLIKSPFPFDLKKKLDEHKIRIRAFQEADGLDGGYYRIAVLNRPQNRRLVECLERIIMKSTVQS